MYDEAMIRHLLVASCHSSSEAEQYFADRADDAELLTLLLKIAVDENGLEGDAPMQAAHFAAQFPGTLLAQYESELLELLGTANGYRGHVAIALAKTGSLRGKAALLGELGDGSRFDAWLFRKALAEYGEA